MKTLQELTRPNIWKLKPYSCARDEFKGEASVYLDANENPNNSPYNRYPDPRQSALKEKIVQIKHARATQLFLGVGSDEPIDLLYRAFCEPRLDNVVAIAPTYGMYGVCADVNDVEYRQVPLNAEFQFSAAELLARCDEHTKLIWLCSPNNPTGNNMQAEEIERILAGFDGITVIDEAYIDFSTQPSWLKKLDEYPNLVVLQTFSKAWGSAAIRLGMAFASEAIIDILNKIKYPYNISLPTQQQAIKMLENAPQVQLWIREILKERTFMQNELRKNKHFLHLYPSDANFILCKVTNANRIYAYLVSEGIIVRNRNSVTLCENCLRISIGTHDENQALLQALEKYARKA